MMFLFYFQMTDLVNNNNRKLFLLLFQIILFDTSETPHLAITATEEKKLQSTQNLKNYFLFQSKGNERKTAKMMRITNKIICYLQSKLL